MDQKLAAEVCKVYKVNDHLQTFEKKKKKTTTYEKIMHGLHNIELKEKTFMQYLYCSC